MNEKDNIRFFTYCVLAALFLGGAIGFLFGRGNSIGSAGLELANHRLTETVRELRTELEAERAITGAIRSESKEERELIKSAIDACGRAGGGLQGIITKMEILNNLIRELERRADRGSDLPEGK